MRRFQEAFQDLTALRSALRGGLRTKAVKQSIGDSMNNNRTLTVSQAIRYTRKNGMVKLALLLEVTTAILEESILDSRKNRTDAIDVNELVTVFRKEVMTNRKFRREIGSAVSKVS